MTGSTASMLAVHLAAIDSKAASYHEFLVRYAKNKCVVYGFVEGKMDPTFYRGFIEHSIPEGWEVELWPAGNKSSVLKIHSDIDWRRFPKKRVCFFVDRDLSELLGEKVPSDSNIYITDGYSIENDVVRRGTVRRALTEVFGFSAVDHDELDQVCDLFDKELVKYQRALIPLMAWILMWRRHKVPANLNNICMQHLFECKAGVIHPISKPKGKTDVCEYIHEQCDVVRDTAVDITDCTREFAMTTVYRRFVRGKYLMWFLVEFCLCIHKHAGAFFSLSRPPTMKVSISQSNGLQILGTRARCPKSLREFMTRTYCDFIEARQR